MIYYSLLSLMYKVYQMGKDASALLSLLSLGLERKMKCYNEYFIHGYVFYTKKYKHERKTYNIGVCVKGIDL